MAGDIYDRGLAANKANYVPLSPLSFLQRAADVYPDRDAVVFDNGEGTIRRSWSQVYERSVKLAHALNQRGIGSGDTVAILSANTPEMFEAHFGVPMAGAVLNAINTRLDADSVSFILEHGEASVFLVDQALGQLGANALASTYQPGLVIGIEDSGVADDVDAALVGTLTYDEFLATGSSNFAWQLPADEWDAIALNYTSGTTGNPKGVVYHHRGAYLNAVSNAVTWNMGAHPVYLWTLPMFHCNGWCFPWTLAVNAGTSVCLRQVREEAVFEAMAEHKVTHFCGAPVVLNTLLNAPATLQKQVQHQVKVMTAGAAPPAAIIEGMQAMGMDVTHVYGLTETYGPVTLCAWRDDLWGQLEPSAQADIKSRQGVRGQMLEGLIVADPITCKPVPKDGETIGEIMMRGNNVMKGYLKNEAATQAAFAQGWFHSGDLAVWHTDGYVQIKDRSKDIIISGGENISSIEIEDVLFRHPAVLEAAVVAKSDDKWGETPCAFICLRDGSDVDADELRQYCLGNMARFKVPGHFVFTQLPKTSTGKVQKFVLREQAEAIAP